MAHDPIDVHVGSRIRLRRNLLGISQYALADTLGITFQQVQKYERGVNRVSASKLQPIAAAFGVPVSYFFEKTLGSANGIADNALGPGGSTNEKEVLSLIRYYLKIRDPEVRKTMLTMIENLGRLAG